MGSVSSTPGGHGKTLGGAKESIEIDSGELVID